MRRAAFQAAAFAAHAFQTRKPGPAFQLLGFQRAAFQMPIESDLGLFAFQPQTFQAAAFQGM